MNRTLSLFGVVLAGLLAATSQRAQAAADPYPIKLTLADKRTIPAATVRRSGNSILVTVPVANGVRGEVGYPAASVTRIEMPEPPQLKTARQLVTDGKAEQALREIGGVVAQQSGLRDIPGNYWAPAALIEVDALIDLKRDRDAQKLIDQLAKGTKDTELLQRARLALATLWTRNGQADKAIPVFDEAIASSKDARTLARAWTSKGDALLAAEDYDGALLAYSTGFQGSGRLLSMSGANGLVILPRGQGDFEAEAAVEALILDQVEAEAVGDEPMIQGI